MFFAWVLHTTGLINWITANLFFNYWTSSFVLIVLYWRVDVLAIYSIIYIWEKQEHATCFLTMAPVRLQNSAEQSVTYNLSTYVADFTHPINYDCRYHSQHLSDCTFQLGIRKNKPILWINYSKDPWYEFKWNAHIQKALYLYWQTIHHVDGCISVQCFVGQWTQIM